MCVYTDVLTQTNIKLECKRADVDVEKLRKTLDEEKRKFKIEKEVSQIWNLGNLYAWSEACIVLCRDIEVLLMSVKTSRKNWSNLK